MIRKEKKERYFSEEKYTSIKDRDSIGVLYVNKFLKFDGNFIVAIWMACSDGGLLLCNTLFQAPYSLYIVFFSVLVFICNSCSSFLQIYVYSPFSFSYFPLLFSLANVFSYIALGCCHTFFTDLWLNYFFLSPFSPYNVIHLMIGGKDSPNTG